MKLQALVVVVVVACLRWKTVASSSCEMPRDCSEYFALGANINGVYKIRLAPGEKIIDVFCDMETDGGGWTVLVRHTRDKTPLFDQNWESYRNGFGDVSKDFWLGNEYIHRLTEQGTYELRVEVLLANGATEVTHAVYESFAIADETDSYRLILGKYVSGNAGDGLGPHNGSRFVTADRYPRVRADCEYPRNRGFWYLDEGYGCRLGCTACNYWRGDDKVYRPLYRSEMKVRKVS